MSSKVLRFNHSNITDKNKKNKNWLPHARKIMDLTQLRKNYAIDLLQIIMFHPKQMRIIPK